MPLELVWAATLSQVGFMPRGTPSLSIKHEPSIKYLELFGVAAAVLLWAHRLPNRRGIIFCDNLGVCHALNASSSNCRNCMVLIRLIALASLQKQKKRFFARYVQGRLNIGVDFLSQNQPKQFKQYALADLGGCAGHMPPPMGPNSFIFAYIFTKKHPCQRSMPLLMGARPLWEIPDPPLVCL